MARRRTVKQVKQVKQVKGARIRQLPGGEL
jgi:hypothetical protein